MIDTIFSCPIRKYNLNSEDINLWTQNFYDRERSECKTPFRYIFNDLTLDPRLTQFYVDVLENFVKDIGLNKTHVAFITGAILCVLEKGETLALCNTLPSHYTFTHYIEGKSPDVYYHPARSLLEVFNPGLDEWNSAMSLYVNKGDVIVHPSYLDYITPPVENRRMTMTLLIELQSK